MIAAAEYWANNSFERRRNITFQMVISAAAIIVVLKST